MRLRSAVSAFINGGLIQLSSYSTQLNHELRSLSLCTSSRDHCVCARRSNSARRSVSNTLAVYARIHAPLSAGSLAKPSDLPSFESVWTAEDSRRPEMLFVSMQYVRHRQIGGLRAE
jgi:hypothetical protein